MSVVIQAKVRTRYPQLTGTPDDTLDEFEDDATAFVDVGYFGTYYNNALAMMTAHLAILALRASGGSTSAGPGVTASGSVLESQTMRLSVKYAPPSSTAAGTMVGSDAWLGLTDAGIAFAALRDTRSGGMPFTVTS